MIIISRFLAGFYFIKFKTQNSKVKITTLKLKAK